MYIFQKKINLESRVEWEEEIMIEKRGILLYNIPDLQKDIWRVKNDG